MKKINKNLIVVIMIFAIILFGMISNSFVGDLKSNFYELIFNESKNDISARIDTFISGVESSSNNVRYHDKCLDLNSYVYYKTNRRVVKKDQDNIVRLDNGYLESVSSLKSLDEQIAIKDNAKQCAYAVIEFNEFLESKNINFLYVCAPKKGYYGGAPSICTNDTKDVYTVFLQELKNNGVNAIDMKSIMDSGGITEEEAFYATDHHWKGSMGFWANGVICKELQTLYGYNYDDYYTDIDNYSVKVYDNIFLGSWGKKVGRYYTYVGLDDLEVIKPKFDTKFNLESSEETKTGNFENVLLDESKINNDYYNTIPYNVYSGGNRAWRNIENEGSTNNCKVLFINDSFANCVIPYFATTTKYTFTVDLRKELFGEGTIDSVKGYIEKINPDYVVMLYSGTTGSGDGSRFDLN